MIVFWPNGFSLVPKRAILMVYIYTLYPSDGGTDPVNSGTDCKSEASACNLFGTTEVPQYQIMWSCKLKVCTYYHDAILPNESRSENWHEIMHLLSNGSRSGNWTILQALPLPQLSLLPLNPTSSIPMRKKSRSMVEEEQLRAQWKVRKIRVGENFSTNHRDWSCFPSTVEFRSKNFKRLRFYFAFWMENWHSNQRV